MENQRNWSQERKNYLQDNWGSISIKAMAKHLSKSENAVLIMKNKMGLGAFLESGEYITFNQLIKALNVGSGGYKMTSWIENRHFPIKYRTVLNCRFKVVYLNEFWKWAETNRTVIDWSRVEKNILGLEPEWVDEQRKLDFIKNSKIKTSKWTPKEDRKLIDLLKQFKYGYSELSEIIHRSEGAIQRRIIDLKLKERPLKADNHIRWKDKEYFKLGEMIKAGYSYEVMSNELGKSAKALRGRVYSMYLTENLDKAAKIIGKGNWGDNRPDRPITHNTLNTEERQTVKRDMTQFVGILKGLIKSHYDNNDFWQHELCMNWDNGCTAGEMNCDSCTNFIRIQPQYCRRCGVTIMSRKKTDMCDKCKTTRKKQFQHKFMALQDKHISSNG